MIAERLDKLSDKQRDKVHDIFLTTAIIYELGGDWKSYLQKKYNTSIGACKQFCKEWLEKGTDRTFDKAIIILLRSVYGPEYN